MKRLLLLCILMLALAPVLLPGSGRAATLTEGPLTVVVPDSVGEGQIFLAEVTLANQVESVTVEWMGKNINVPMVKRDRVFKGVALLGVGLGTRHGQQTIVVDAVRPNRRELVLGKIEVTAVAFPEQRLTLPSQMVTPSRQNLERIKHDRELINKALATLSPERLWSFPFLRPVWGEVTSDFGLRRILNGQPRSPHNGIDFDARTGEEVHAANQGRVILSGDFYFNGKSVFLDHGQGVITMYFHLSDIKVTTGQSVQRGQVLGLAGATGRATGPHLHFGMRILGQAVDPMPLFTAGGPFDRSGKE